MFLITFSKAGQEDIVLTEDDLFGFRFADGTLFKPACIHHAGDGTALAQQDALPGKRAGDEVIDEVFRRFCVGK